MKQKYTILRDENTGGLKIQEHAELSKDLFSLICEESYDAEAIKNAMNESKTVLIDTLRTPNLYPVSEYIGKIADQVIALYDPLAESQETGPIELLFDDVELFRKEGVPGEISTERSVEIEDLLEDDTDDDDTDDDTDIDDDTDAEIDTGAAKRPSRRDIPIDTADDESLESADDEDEL
jgi:hypothetical protein